MYLSCKQGVLLKLKEASGFEMSILSIYTKFPELFSSWPFSLKKFRAKWFALSAYLGKRMLSSFVIVGSYDTKEGVDCVHDHLKFF